MDHRTYGETRDCKGCRFWSEMIAQSAGTHVEALCLSQESPDIGKYKAPHGKCDAWKSGYLGAIDEPGPDNMVALYAQQDAELGDGEGQ